MDYNWFFSSTSQCCAAIVGFFGGFIITKIINREVEFNNLKSKYKEVTTNITFQKNKLDNRFFNWYNERKRDQVFDSNEFNKYVYDNINKEVDIDNYLDDIIFEFNFSKWDSIESLKTEIYTKVHKLVIEKIKQRSRREYPFYYSPTPRIMNNNVQEEYEMIQDEITKTKKICDEVLSLRYDMESFPKGVQIISNSIKSIFILFFIGIIYPLSFMPVDNNFAITVLPKGVFSSFFSLLTSIQGILLFVISAVFVYLIAKFYTINKSQIFDDRLIIYLNEYEKLENYSNYLKNSEIYNEKYDDYRKSK